MTVCIFVKEFGLTQHGSRTETMDLPLHVCPLICVESVQSENHKKHHIHESFQKYMLKPQLFQTVKIDLDWVCKGLRNILILCDKKGTGTCGIATSRSF